MPVLTHEHAFCVSLCARGTEVVNISIAISTATEKSSQSRGVLVSPLGPMHEKTRPDARLNENEEWRRCN